METRSTENRRSTLVVDPKVQKRIVVAVTVFPAAAMAMATLVVAVFCRRLLGEASRGEIELPSLLPLFWAMLAFVAVSGVVIVVQALRFSHRIAGPSYRIVKSIERIRTGDVAFKVQLRRGDHLVEIADELNRLLDWLSSQPRAEPTTKEQQSSQAVEPRGATAKRSPPGD